MKECECQSRSQTPCSHAAGEPLRKGLGRDALAGRVLPSVTSPLPQKRGEAGNETESFSHSFESSSVSFFIIISATSWTCCCRCSFAFSLSDAMLCDRRSSLSTSTSAELSSILLSSPLVVCFAFLCIPRSQGAVPALRWDGRGREWRTMAPYNPYSAMIEL